MSLNFAIILRASFLTLNHALVAGGSVSPLPTSPSPTSPPLPCSFSKELHGSPMFSTQRPLVCRHVWPLPHPVLEFNHFPPKKKKLSCSSWHSLPSLTLPVSVGSRHPVHGPVTGCFACLYLEALPAVAAHVSVVFMPM